MNIIGKIGRAVYYGIVTWAIMLILCGVPFLNALRDMWPWIMMVLVAVFVEGQYGRSPRIILELVIDIGIGAIGVLVADFMMWQEFFQNLGSQFSIPCMSTLIIYIVVAFVAQLEVRAKKPRRGRRPRRENEE